MKNHKIYIQYVENPLERGSRKIKEFDYDPTLTLKDYLKKSGFKYKKCKIIHNDKEIKKVGKQKLNPNDIIIVTPQVKVSAALGLIGSLLINSGWSWGWVALGYVLVAAAIVYSFITAPSARKQNFGETGAFEDSPTYGWDGIQTMQDAGVSVGVVYGEHRVGGNIINAYVEEGENQTLNVLLALCEGEIESISNVEINGNPLENYYEDDSHGETTFRMGTNSQTAIEEFGDLHSVQDMNIQLTKNNSYEYTTSGSSVESFKLGFQLPNGLYEQNENNGDINAWTVTYKVEYKKSSDPSYTCLGTFDISKKSRTRVRRFFKSEYLDADEYDIRITRTSDDSTFYKTGDLYLTSVDEIQTQDLVYPNTALAGFKLLATEHLSGNMPNFTVLIRGKKVSIPKVMNGADEVDWEDYYWNADNSEWRKISDDTSLTWDGSTWVDRYCANPIWCIQDLLTNDRYGLGEYIGLSDINDSEMLEMARYCDELVEDGEGEDEKRFRLDVILDAKSDVFEVLKNLLASFNAYPIYSEGKIKIFIEKTETASQLFTMGNIIDGSFKINYGSDKQVPNVIEIQYANKNKSYGRDTIEIGDSSLFGADEPSERNPETISLFGCTRTSQAVRIGTFRLNRARNNNKTIQFKAPIDAIGCTVGDVFNFAHEMPQWGLRSGRVKSGSTTTKVVIDRAVSLASGTNYEIVVRDNTDDTIETIAIDEGTTGQDTEVTEIHLESALSFTPSDYDVYSIGEVDISTKPYRLMQMRRTSEGEVEMTAIEYTASIYTDDSITVPEDNYSHLTLDVPTVTNLDTSERNTRLDDGTIETAIDVSWDEPAASDRWTKKVVAYDIYMSDDAGDSYHKVGTTDKVFFSITSELSVGETYKIAVISIADTGEKTLLNNSPSDSITMSGYSDAPADVSNFQASFTDEIDFTWDKNSEPNVIGYEIRTEDTDWGSDDAELEYRALANKFTEVRPSARSGVTYYIKAYNTSGAYSANAVSVTPTNAAPDAPASVSSDIFWNIARVQWTDVGDADIQYYEVYVSETNTWGGEEELFAKVSGTSVNIEGRKPRSGVVDSSTSTTIVDANLIGLGDDYFNGDKLEITSGSDSGNTYDITDFASATGTITVASWNTQPSADDLFQIRNQKYVKVRGVDSFGEGSLTGSHTVTYTAFDEDAFEDNSVSARKMYISCLSAISANMGCLTSGIIEGGTIQTGSSGSRTMFSGTGIYSYDASCNKTFEVLDGNICAQNLKLFDLDCNCCYSYLDHGAIKFHDECGDVPYVKRVCSGDANTGDTVCLPGWKTAPEVMVGIKSLCSYASAQSAQDQQWQVYADNISCYDAGGSYGYCFDVHAALVLASGQGSECIKDVNFGTAVCTEACACETCVRNKFELYCHGAAPANYHYGCLCYEICYRVNGDPSWCSCSFCYEQPHGSTGDMTSVHDDYANMVFPCEATWELMACETGISWHDSGIASGSINCCLCERSITATSTHWHECKSTDYNGNVDLWCCDGDCSVCTSIGGTTPSNVYCTYLCYSWCSVDAGGGDPHICAVSTSAYTDSHWSSCAEAWSTSYLRLCGCQADYERAHSYKCMKTFAYDDCEVCQHCFNSQGCENYDCLNNCTLDNLELSIHASFTLPYCSTSGFTCNCTCLLASCLYQCYCEDVGGSTCCKYEKLYSICDTYGCTCTLDPSGVLNWLAIAYT